MVLNKPKTLRVRVKQNRTITENPRQATMLAFRRHFCRDRDFVFEGMSIGGSPFVARCRDWLAAQEVVFDEEYKTALLSLEGTQTPLVVDGGANIELFALYLFHHCPTAQIHSYEASASAFGVLSKNKN